MSGEWATKVAASKKDGGDKLKEEVMEKEMKVDEEGELKPVHRRRRVPTKEGAEERPSTPTPPEEEEEKEGGKKDEDEEVEEEKDGEEEELPEDLAVMGQKVEEIKGDVGASEEEVAALVASDKQKRDALAAAEVLLRLKPEDRRLFNVLLLLLGCVLSIFMFTPWMLNQPVSPYLEHSTYSTKDVQQVADLLRAENSALQEDVTNLQEMTLEPIKIKGKEGEKSRQLRELIHQLIAENEDLRLSVGRLWLSEQYQPSPQDKAAFNQAVADNHKLRVDSQKLKHLGADLQDLETSLSALKEENHNLRVAYAEFKYQKVAMPKELDVVSREVEGLVKQVHDASRKKTPPPNLANAKNYVAFMGQILTAMSSLHEFGEAGTFGKIDIAADVFTELSPKASSIPPAVEQKLRAGRAKFEELKASLNSKWGQLKSLSEPENIQAVGRDTLAKMNRVLVNVVSKLKEIGQAVLLRRGKTPVDKTVSVLSEKLALLDTHFDKTWDELEAEVNMDAVDEELANEMNEDEGDEPTPPEEEEEVVEESEVPAAEVEVAKEDVVEEPKAAAAVATDKKVKKKREEKVEGIERKSKAPDALKEAGGEVEKKDKAKKPDSKEVKQTESKKKSREEETKKVTTTGEREKKNKDIKKVDKTKTEMKAGKPSQDQNESKDKKSKSKSSGGSSKDSGRKDSGSKKSKDDSKDAADNGRYFKGHYNKDKGDSDSSDSASASDRKKHLKRQDPFEEDEYDDKDDVTNDKKSGLKRHWEKPVKKNFFRESAESRRQFIRRKDF